MDQERPSIVTVIVLGCLIAGLGLLEAVYQTASPVALIPLREMDEALTRRDAGAAGRAWHAAYVAASDSRSWERLVEVGDAALRLGTLSGSRARAEANARTAYLAALFAARTERAVDGVLRVAEAFQALGDAEAARESLKIAAELARTARAVWTPGEDPRSCVEGRFVPAENARMP